MTPQTREELINAYAQATLETMSGRDLERFFLDVICERLESLSDSELKAELEALA